MQLSWPCESWCEAAKRTSEATQERHPEVAWPQIIGMRNRLVHGYDVVDLSILRDIVQNDLPPLVEQLASIVERGHRW